MIKSRVIYLYLKRTRDTVRVVSEAMDSHHVISYNESLLQLSKWSALYCGLLFTFLLVDVALIIKSQSELARPTFSQRSHDIPLSLILPFEISNERF